MDPCFSTLGVKLLKVLLGFKEVNIIGHVYSEAEITIRFIKYCIYRVIYIYIYIYIYMCVCSSIQWSIYETIPIFNKAINNICICH